VLVCQVCYEKLLSSLSEGLLVSVFGSVLLERRIIFCAQQFRFDSLTVINIISYHIKTWQLTTSVDLLRTYKIDAEYNIKHSMAAECKNNVLKTGRSLDVS